MSATAQQHFHGSDRELIEKVYHIPKEEIISFSANVNPLGISPLMKEQLLDHIDCITEYPDRSYESLRAAIARYLSCDSAHLIVGNGSTELISLFIRLIAPSRAMIVAPTYFEYERELSLEGCSHTYYHLREEDDFRLDIADLKKALDACFSSAPNTGRMLILCNPNNPTSSCITCDEMRTLLDYCETAGIYVLTDETYVEFTDETEQISSVPLVPEFSRLIILRGTSKFFACPGLRLGYGLCSDTALLARAARIQNPWSLNSLGAVAGEIMFSDQRYIERTRQLITTERRRIFRILQAKHDVKVYEPHANFLLLRLLRQDLSAHDLFEKAIRQKLMIRDCSEFESLDASYLRFCFMLPADNDKLLSVLALS